MRHIITGLNDRLVAVLERLRDKELAGKKLRQEIRRTEVVCDLAREIVDTYVIVILSERFIARYGLPTECAEANKTIAEIRRLIARRERTAREAVTCRAS
jgi:hypothetical protein